jgi:acyl-CoA synthetase (NDP forming)
MGEAAAKRLLRNGGLPVPEGVELEIGDEDGCVVAASELGWPVALKLSGRAVRHKTDTGALALGIAAEEDLRRARGRLADLPEADGASLLVERMVRAAVSGNGGERGERRGEAALGAGGGQDSVLAS